LVVSLEPRRHTCNTYLPVYLLMMSNRPRNFVAVLIVVTALCADRSVFGAPIVRTQAVEQTAARIIDRLTFKFRNAVPVAVVFDEHRADHFYRPPFHPVAPADVEPVHRPTLPSFYRLPPPRI
jgi:hypothetical protein